MVQEEELTKTTAKMWKILQDGSFHTREQLHACLWDPLAEISAIQYHIHKLREVVGPHGLKIVAREVDGRRGYILVRAIQYKE